MECQLDKMIVEYESFGEGRPMIILHGAPTDLHHMKYELERHFTNRKGWKRIYVNMPGSGKTPAADWITSVDQVLNVVSEFIDKLIPGERFVAAGTSYGGYIARGLAYRKGAEMDGLFLNVPATFPRVRRALPPRIILVSDQAIIDKARSENLSWFEELAVVQGRSALEYVRILQKSVADEKFYGEITEGAFSFNVDKPSQPFPAPALFIFGRQDHIVGYRDAWAILEDFPRGTFAVLDRGGHLLAGEQRELCAALTNEWLDRVEEWVKAHRGG